MILLNTKFCFYVSTQYLSNKNIINIFIKFNIQNLRVYRYNFCNNYDDAKDYYDNTLNKAADCEDQRPKATA